MCRVAESDGVYDSAKILIWKQITTQGLCGGRAECGVYDSAKILIWKQITTFMLCYDWKRLVYMTLQRY